MWGNKWPYEDRYSVVLTEHEIDMIIFAFGVSSLEGQNTNAADALYVLFGDLLKQKRILPTGQEKGDAYVAKT